LRKEPFHLYDADEIDAARLLQPLPVPSRLRIMAVQPQLFKRP
jgi:hypothetical protein